MCLNVTHDKRRLLIKHTMPIAVLGFNDICWLNSDIEMEQRAEIDQREINMDKNHFAILGHYWIEVNGEVVDDKRFVKKEKKFSIRSAVRYYKPAPEQTQKLAIEMMYRHNEFYYNVKRDTGIFQELVSMLKIQYRRCNFNCLSILQKYPTGKIVFGSFGYKYPKGIPKTNFPKNGVEWVFGLETHKTFNDYFVREKYHDVRTGTKEKSNKFPKIIDYKCSKYSKKFHTKKTGYRVKE